MMKVRSFKFLLEASYFGNIGFQEMVKFYQKASSSDQDLMDQLVRKNDWEGFKKLIKKVLGITLK